MGVLCASPLGSCPKLVALQPSAKVMAIGLKSARTGRSRVFSNSEVSNVEGMLNDVKK